MKAPYYGASAAPPDSAEGSMVASARHLAEHLGEAPVLISRASHSILARGRP
jgi:hypothetical protein